MAADVSQVDLGMPSTISVTVPNSYYSATYVKVPFPHVVRDASGYWDAVSKQFIIPTTIPADTYGIFNCNIRWQDTGGYRVQVLVSKYDASTGVQLQSQYPEAQPDNRPFTGGTTTDHTGLTHPVLLEAGDAYACQVWQSGASGSSGALNVVSAGFSMLVLP